MFESELKSVDADIIERFKEEYGPDDPYSNFPYGSMPILTCQLIRSIQQLTAAVEALNGNRRENM